MAIDYKFDVQSGVRTDDYRVRVVKNASGVAVPLGSQLSASITRGNQFVRGLDLPVAGSQPGPATTAVAAASAIAAPLVTADGIDQVMSDIGVARRRRV